MRTLLLPLLIVIPCLACADDPPDVAKIRKEIASVDQAITEKLQDLDVMRKQRATLHRKLRKALLAKHEAELQVRIRKHKPDELVRQLVPLLANPSWKVRKAAEKHLRALRHLALPELDRQRPRVKNPEATMRIKRILAAIRAVQTQSLIAATAGGRVEKCTNQWGGEWGADMAIDGKITTTAWCNAGGAGFKAEFVFAIGNKDGGWVNEVGINNWAQSYETGGVKQFRVLVSSDPAGKKWETLGTFTAKQTNADKKDRIQRFEVPPVFARRVKLQLIDHHGHPSYAILNEFGVYGSPELPNDRAFAEARAFVAQHGK